MIVCEKITPRSDPTVQSPVVDAASVPTPGRSAPAALFLVRPMYDDLAPPLDVDALHARLYAGAIARFAPLEGMAAVLAVTQGFVEDALAPHPPTEIHRHHDQAALAALLAETQRGYANLPEAKAAWAALWGEVGIDPEDAARDRLTLRFQPPAALTEAPGVRRPWARSTATVSFHRDTWGTNLYAQINWWAPVYPITKDRTFAFLSDLFARPIENSSADFDIADVIRRNREAPETVKEGEMVPHLLEEVDLAAAQPVTIAPGEIIAFSAQHAHVGLENTTDLTRISLDTRTLRISDARAGRGAANVDGRAKWATYGMFRRLSDGAALADVLGVERMAVFGGEP